MRYLTPAFKWLNKKYFSANENRYWFKLSISFSEPINFLVQYPISDKHCLIKEYLKNEWLQEITLLDPANVYLKVFLTTNNHIKEVKVKLNIEQIISEESPILIEKTFHIDESYNFNDWLQIKWLDRTNE